MFKFSGRIRPSIQKRWSQDPDFRIFVGQLDPDRYQHHLKTSKFCLCLRGYQVNNIGLDLGRTESYKRHFSADPKYISLLCGSLITTYVNQCLVSKSLLLWVLEDFEVDWCQGSVQRSYILLKTSHLHRLQPCTLLTITDTFLTHSLEEAFCSQQYWYPFQICSTIAILDNWI